MRLTAVPAATSVWVPAGARTVAHTRVALWCALAALACACSSREPAAPQLRVGPVSEADATAFAQAFATRVKPCDDKQLAALIDAEAMAAKWAAQTSLPGKVGAARQLARATTGARILCAWMKGVDEYKLLRVRAAGNEPRPIFRRVIRDPRSGAIVVGYDELQLGTSPSDREVRIVDAFSYVQGQWITQLLGGNLDAMAKSLDYLGDLPLMAGTVREARDLQRAGKNAEALQIIDALPSEVRNYRGVQMMRVRAAAGISKDAYRQALVELAGVFPGDPSIAMVQADGAFVLGDHDAALRWIDVVDKAIGGDAFQEAHRALAYLRKGDLAKAATHADAAIAMEPGLDRARDIKAEVDRAVAASKAAPP